MDAFSIFTGGDVGAPSPTPVPAAYEPTRDKSEAKSEAKSEPTSDASSAELLAAEADMTVDEAFTAGLGASLVRSTCAAATNLRAHSAATVRTRIDPHAPPLTFHRKTLTHTRPHPLSHAFARTLPRNPPSQPSHAVISRDPHTQPSHATLLRNPPAQPPLAPASADMAESSLRQWRRAAEARRPVSNFGAKAKALGHECIETFR